MRILVARAYTLALIIDDLSSLKIRFGTEANRYADKEIFENFNVQVATNSTLQTIALGGLVGN
jgi:hypothetical protein